MFINRFPFPSSHGPSEEYGCGIAPFQDYNLGLHIGAVFILLAASLAGVLIPEVMRWLRSDKNVTEKAILTGDLGFGPRVSNAIFALRFFGGGILLSTAFVHLVAHAITYFSNSCIGELQYEATPAAIMMAAVWLMIVINFLIMRPLRRKAALAIANQQALRSTNSQSSHETAEEFKQRQDESHDQMRYADEEHLQSKIKLDESELTFLEAGIIVHSIVIGITIGTSSGEGWVAFLIAILWHQFCEGLALASRIVLIPTLSTLKIWVMYLAFVITTPVGIAIGIGVRQSFNGNDRATLLVIGILTAISAGILLYSSFIQVIAHDFLHDPRMHNASWTRALAAIVFFTLGAIAMVSAYMHRSKPENPFTDLSFLFFFSRFLENGLNQSVPEGKNVKFLEHNVVSFRTSKSSVCIMLLLCKLLSFALCSFF